MCEVERSAQLMSNGRISSSSTHGQIASRNMRVEEEGKCTQAHNSVSKDSEALIRGSRITVRQDPLLQCYVERGQCGREGSWM
jgi:hypothetical protein